MVKGVDPRIRPQVVWRSDWILPNASVWTIWSEVCRRNGLNRLEADDLLAGRGITRSLFTTREDAAWLGELRGLLPQAKRMACQALRFDAAVTALHSLRYCALCMGHRYHAACFQHRSLDRCPVHDVGLEDRCNVCGLALLVHADAARRVPFGCARCGAWLGVAGYAMPPQATLQTVMEATSQSLTSAARTGQGTANGLFRRDIQGNKAPGHLTWWAGHDAFIAGSGWKAQSRTFSIFGDEPADLLHAGAWRTLCDFMELHSRLSGHEAATVMEAANDITRQRVQVLRRLPLTVWAMATLICRYGGPRPLERAMRLTGGQVRLDAFGLTPQASMAVTGCAAANCVVFEAELRQELVTLLRQVHRRGHVELDDLAGSPTRQTVPWRLEPRDRETAALWWRSWSTQRYRALLHKRRLTAL